jgi:hypothetical protein
MLRVALYPILVLHKGILVCLPRATASRFEYVLRYIMKATQRIYVPILRQGRKIRPPQAMELRALPRAAAVDAGSKALVDFLRFDILTLISNHLHYADMVNLSLTSRPMRQVIFPPGEFHAASQLYKTYTCRSNPRSDCWVCQVPICKVRHEKFFFCRFLSQDMISLHHCN